MNFHKNIIATYLFRYFFLILISLISITYVPVTYSGNPIQFNVACCNALKQQYYNMSFKPKNQADTYKPLQDRIKSFQKSPLFVGPPHNRNLDPHLDIVGLQEYYDNQTPQIYLNNPRSFYIEKDMGLYLATKKDTFNLIEKGSVSFQTPKADHNGFLYQILSPKNNPQQTIAVINAHLKGGPDAPDGYTYQSFREAQLTEIIQFIKGNYPHVTRWIIMGDFNWRYEDKYKGDKNIEDWIHDADKKLTVGSTATTNYDNGRLVKLDYILSKNLTRSNESVYPPVDRQMDLLLTHSSKDDQSRDYFSDHAILFATFEIPSAKPLPPIPPAQQEAKPSMAERPLAQQQHHPLYEEGQQPQAQAKPQNITKQQQELIAESPHGQGHTKWKDEEEKSSHWRGLMTAIDTLALGEVKSYIPKLIHPNEKNPNPDLATFMKTPLEVAQQAYDRVAASKNTKEIKKFENVLKYIRESGKDPFYKRWFKSSAPSPAKKPSPPIATPAPLLEKGPHGKGYTVWSPQEKFTNWLGLIRFIDGAYLEGIEQLIPKYIHADEKQIPESLDDKKAPRKTPLEMAQYNYDQKRKKSKDNPDLIEKYKDVLEYIQSKSDKTSYLKRFTQFFSRKPIAKQPSKSPASVPTSAGRAADQSTNLPWHKRFGNFVSSIGKK